MYTKKYTLQDHLLPSEFTKTVGNKILHVQFTTHKAAMPFYNVTVRFKFEHYTRECFKLTDFWYTLYVKFKVVGFLKFT
jgi:hypothetical protein